MLAGFCVKLKYHIQPLVLTIVLLLKVKKVKGPL